MCYPSIATMGLLSISSTNQYSALRLGSSVNPHPLPRVHPPVLLTVQQPPWVRRLAIRTSLLIDLYDARCIGFAGEGFHFLEQVGFADRKCLLLMWESDEPYARLHLSAGYPKGRSALRTCSFENHLIKKILQDRIRENAGYLLLFP